MKLNKILFLIFLVNICFALNILSQTERFDMSRPKVTLRNGDEQTPTENYYDVLSNRINVTAGSPFNSNSNSPIDSVVLKKTYSQNDYEIIKYYYAYDSIGNVATEIKEKYWKQINAYDSIGNKINYIWQVWANDKWVNFAYLVNIHDSLSRRTALVDYHWNGSNWENNMQNTYYYNSRGDITSYLSEDWDGNKWINSFRRINTYDSNYVLTESLFQNWDVDDWDGNTWKELYEYDSNGNRIVFISQDLNGNNWVNSYRWSYEYDKKCNNTLTLFDWWRDNNWVSNYRWVNTYNEKGNPLTTLEEIFETIKWENYNYAIYSYNSDGDLDSAKCDWWIDSAWIPGNTSFVMYDSERNRRVYFGTKIKMYYAETTDVNANVKELNNYYLFQNYPNPFNLNTIIRYTLPEQSLVHLDIYNILGQKIKTLVNENQPAGNYEIVFNAKGFSSGIYIYKLQNEEFVDIKKLMLIK